MVVLKWNFHIHIVCRCEAVKNITEDNKMKIAICDDSIRDLAGIDKLLKK